MKLYVSFKLFTPATPVKSKLNSCQAFAAVTPTDSFRMLLQLLQILIKVYPQLETKLYLNSFFVEKSTADAITILAPAHG
jgi:hypothetical protein